MNFVRTASQKQISPDPVMRSRSVRLARLCAAGIASWAETLMQVACRSAGKNCDRSATSCWQLRLLTSVAVCIAAGLTPVPAFAQAARFATEAEIKKAIDNGQRLLLRKLATEPDAQAALSVVALVKSGVDPKSTAINAVCERLVAHCQSKQYTPGVHHIYEASVSLLALANVDAKLYRPQINVMAQYIISSQGKFGQWHYPNSEEGDTRIDQKPARVAVDGTCRAYQIRASGNRRRRRRKRNSKPVAFANSGSNARRGYSSINRCALRTVSICARRSFGR